MDAVGEYLAGNKQQPLDDILEDSGFEDMRDSAVEAGKALTEALENAPTQYFEAKSNRVVQLEDFSCALVPSDISNSVRDVLSRHGVEVVEYDRDKTGDRQRAVSGFHEKEMVLFQMGQAAQAKLERDFAVWHETVDKYTKGDLEERRAVDVMTMPLALTLAGAELLPVTVTVGGLRHILEGGTKKRSRRIS